MKGLRPCSRLTGFTLIELMIVVAILGILAVVAIPAFVRYMRVAKTAEAYRMLDKMSRGEMTYFMTPHHDQQGRPVECHFPFGISAWPPNYYCCQDGEMDGKCEPNETRWESDDWKALLFKISDKHYYMYGRGSFNTAQGFRTKAVSAAVGDLDCDGTYSSFFVWIQGSHHQTQPWINCTAQRTPATVYRETE